jgi:type IV pilus assembly protein PilP
MIRRSLVLSLAVLAAGCADDKPAPRPTAPPRPRPENAAVVEPAKTAAPSEPEFVYSGAAKRDPFRSYLAEMAKDNNGFTSRCAGPLGKFELEQLRLVAVITGLEDPVAMVQLPEGDGFVLRRGSCIGKNGGVVAAIRTGEVIVTEWRVRADGTRDPVQTSLQLPKPPPLNPEE